MKKMISFGVIGMGSQGTVYARLLEESASCQLVALSSRSEEKRGKFAALYPEVAYYTDWKQMIDGGVVDAVIIATPHKNHPELAMYCIQHGVHVLLDKPAGLHSGEVSDLNRCAEAHPEVAFGMMFNQRTNPIYQRARELVQSGELGNLRRALWTTTNWWRPDQYYDQSDWRGTWDGEGGGVLMNQAPHQLDIWQWICGMPQSLYASARFGAYRKITVDNDVSIIAEYENGATGTFITCAHDPLGVDRLELTLDGGKILIEGGGKTGKIYRLNHSEQEMNVSMPMEQVTAFIQGKPLPPLYTVEALSCAEGWGQQHATMIENFVQHILSGSPLLAPGIEGICSLQLANAALMSGWTGEKISFPLDEEDYLERLNQKIALEGISGVKS